MIIGRWLRHSALVLAALAAGGAATTLAAQRAKRPKVGPDGCPVRLLRPGEQPAAPGAPAPASCTPGGAGGAGAAGGGAVTAQSVARPAAAGAFTAGLAIQPFAGGGDAERDAYVARFSQLLDSAVVTLVGVFRNTSGQPVDGADAPTDLSQRERDRWIRCRDLHFDLQSFAPAFQDLERRLPSQPSVARAGAQLDSALAAIQATDECDNLASMIVAPGRWTPWGNQYTAAARHFYRDWYDQVREADEKNRDFVIAFNSTRSPGARIPVPPALPRTPPYAGAGPRD